MRLADNIVLVHTRACLKDKKYYTIHESMKKITEENRVCLNPSKWLFAS